jgi:RNA polymerase sigma-70 factor (ECF subfamily)
VDPELVIRAQAGDQSAFERLAMLVGDRFHGVAFNILRDLHLAEDATQQALLAIWRDLPQLRDPRRFDAWSYRVLVRACHAEGRKQRRWLSGLASWPALEPPAPGDDSGIVADRDQFERGFSRLSFDHRVVIVLHHYLGLTIEDVAAALGIPAGTARSRLDRALKALRLALVADVLPAPVAAAPPEVIR